MSDPTPPLKPLLQAPPSEPPSEIYERAAELLRKVGEPAALHPSRARRILDGVYDQLSTPPRRRWLPLVTATVAAGAAVLLVAGVWRARTPAPIVAEHATAPIAPQLPAPPRVAPAHWVSVGGVAEARDGRVILRSGRLVLAAGDGATRVELPSQKAQLTVRPHTLVDVRVTRWRVQVSAFAGSAIYESHDFGPRELGAGHTLLAGSELVERSNDAGDEPKVQKLLADGDVVAAIEDRPERTAPEHTTVEVTKIDPASTVDPVSAEVAKIDPPILERPLVEPLKVAPAPVANVVAPPGPSALALETASFERAVKALRHDHDPAAALHAADAYLKAYPHGLMQPDAEVLRIEAQLALGQREGALKTLDHTTLTSLPRADEMAVIRGELRAAVGRCSEADADFLPHLSGADELAERALMARAECRAHQGNDAEARSLLEEYSRRFANGRFSARAAHILKN